MKANEARALREAYWFTKEDEINEILKLIYEMIEDRSKNGYGSVIFSLSDIFCPSSLEKAIINRLNQDGYQLSYCMGEWTVKW